jgi:hypothetical protein
MPRVFKTKWAYKDTKPDIGKQSTLRRTGNILDALFQKRC